MKFSKGYKYRTHDVVTLQTSFRPPETIECEWMRLDTDGLLTLHIGYMWDGASGPVYDRKTNYVPSAGHDGLYQMMRLGLLPHGMWRKADNDFVRWEGERGAWKITQKIDLAGLKIANGRAAHPSHKRKIYEAP